MKKQIKPRRLFVDQYGNRFYADTIRELRGQIGGGGAQVHRMYHEAFGEAHIGYVIGHHWLTEYQMVVRPRSVAA